MEGFKTWLAYKRQTSLAQAHKNLFADTTSVSTPAMTTFRSSLNMYVLFVYNNVSHCLYNKLHPKLTESYFTDTPPKNKN
jgi:hypothetical protein